MKSLHILIFILSSPFALIAQNIHGLWSGTMVNDSTHRTQNFELGLSEYRGKITGYTYTTFIDNDTFYYSIKRIKAERKDGKLVIEDDEMVGNNFPERAAKHVKQTTVFPLINDSTIDVTKGKWSTNQTKKYYSIGGSTTVREQNDETQSDLMAHLQEANIKTDIVVHQQKKNENNTMAKNLASVETRKKNNREITENKKSDIAKNADVKEVSPTKETQKNGTINPVEQDNKANVASNKIEDKGAETNTVASKTALTDNNISKDLDKSKRNDQALSPTKSIVKKDTTQELAQQLFHPDKNSEKPKMTSGGSTNIPMEQKKDLVVSNKQKEPDGNKMTGQINSVKNNNSGNPNRNKPKNDPVVSQAKSTLKKDTVTQVVQKTNPSPDKNAETQKIASIVSTNMRATQRKDLIQGSKELPVIVASRTNENMQDVYFKNDSLVLSLYDNGIVDGDTVSVFLNGESVVSKQMLKTSAIKKTIYISPNMDSVQLVLFAENLGTIPPNTGLLTVRDGDNVYQVRFSADLQKNASITLRRKKE